MHDERISHQPTPLSSTNTLSTLPTPSLPSAQAEEYEGKHGQAVEMLKSLRAAVLDMFNRCGCGGTGSDGGSVLGGSGGMVVVGR